MTRKDVGGGTSVAATNLRNMLRDSREWEMRGKTKGMYRKVLAFAQNRVIDNSRCGKSRVSGTNGGGQVLEMDWVKSDWSVFI